MTESRNVDSEIPLHKCPVCSLWCVALLLLPPTIHNHLLDFADTQERTQWQVAHLFKVGLVMIVVGSSLLFLIKNLTVWLELVLTHIISLVQGIQQESRWLPTWPLVFWQLGSPNPSTATPHVKDKKWVNGLFHWDTIFLVSSDAKAWIIHLCLGLSVTDHLCLRHSAYPFNRFLFFVSSERPSSSGLYITLRFFHSPDRCDDL